MTPLEFLSVKGLVRDGEQDYPILTHTGTVSLVDLLAEYSGFATLEPAEDPEAKKAAKKKA